MVSSILRASGLFVWGFFRRYRKCYFIDSCKRSVIGRLRGRRGRRGGGSFFPVFGQSKISKSVQVVILEWD
jgi:hypothetical protein